MSLDEIHITNNGVVFAAENSGNLNDSAFRYGASGSFINHVDGNMYTGSAVTGLSNVDRDDLLDKMGWSNAANSWRMGVKNLVAGRKYLIQALLSDDRGGLGNRNMHFSPHVGTWGPAYDYSSRADDHALLMTGTFTADSTLQEFRQGIAGIGHPQFQALQIRDITIPEPATATLAMLGLGGLLMRRRRAA
jgi:hypothetical protein